MKVVKAVSYADYALCSADDINAANCF